MSVEWKAAILLKKLERHRKGKRFSQRSGDHKRLALDSLTASEG